MLMTQGVLLVTASTGSAVAPRVMAHVSLVARPSLATPMVPARMHSPGWIPAQIVVTRAPLAAGKMASAMAAADAHRMRTERCVRLITAMVPTT